MKTIKAQNVQIGAILSVNGIIAELTVERIETFKCGDGETGYRFFDASTGRTVWNRHGEELILSN